MLVDTHAHLTMPELARDLSGVLDRASVAGVSRVVCVGIDVPSSRLAVQIAGSHPMVCAAVGVHPNECAVLESGWLGELRGLTAAPKVVAIGEIGLDYYRGRTDREQQRKVLDAQLDLAAELGLPVVVHNRQAGAELIGTLEAWAEGLPEGQRRGVLHCFSGDLDLLDRCCQAGFYVSYAGPVTFQNARDTARLVASTPRDRVLVETDSPYLAPHPFRGRRNEPAFVRLVAERVGAILGESLLAVADLTSRNSGDLFGFAPVPIQRES